MNNISEENEVPKYRHFEQTVVRKIQHFYISCGVDDPVYYTDMIHRIHSAGPDDIIYMHLNTPGGRLDTGMQIINAMRATAAHVVASIESEAYSLGTLIFLAADEFVVHDNVIMMFHNYSGGTYGKGHEQTAMLEGVNKWFNDVARKLYLPFLSEEELERIIRGEDLYIHSDEIRKRLERMVEEEDGDDKAGIKRKTSKKPAHTKKPAATKKKTVRKTAK